MIARLAVVYVAWPFVTLAGLWLLAEAWAWLGRITRYTAPPRLRHLPDFVDEDLLKRTLASYTKQPVTMCGKQTRRPINSRNA